MIRNRSMASMRALACLTAGLLLSACDGAPAPAPERDSSSAGSDWETVDTAWGNLPDGRDWGAVSAIYPGPDGRTIWVAERCGQNSCIDRPGIDPVLQFDLEGNLLQSFGAGMFAWPHGMYVDSEGNVWVADALGFGQQPEGWGHIVVKFSPEGEVLLTLGERGQAGGGALLNKPSDIVVAPDGHIFIADGHDAGGSNRIAKFDAEGNFVMEWGDTGGDRGEFMDPHALAMDSEGRLFVADRANNRIQLFTQEGEFIQSWTQFARISGMYIDENDILFAVDSESNMRRNPGWNRGVYIGSVRDGWVTDFIPDPEPDPDNSGTSGGEGVAVDAEGNVYTAEVGPRTVQKHVRRGGS